jgi:hypothetical protein
MSEETRTCYGCLHRVACKWTWQMEDRVPFISDAHIAPFLKDVNRAIATACSFYTEGPKETS